MAKKSSSIIFGSLSQAIAQIGALPKGRPLSEVLKLVQGEIDSSKVRVSQNLHRATLEVSTGKVVTVRVTAVRGVPSGGHFAFRFKPPRDLSSYDRLYFGGLNPQGKAVVHKFKPEEIGTRQTLTLRVGAKGT